jgi:hypothetical protein
MAWNSLAGWVNPRIAAPHCSDGFWCPKHTFLWVWTQFLTTYVSCSWKHLLWRMRKSPKNLRTEKISGRHRYLNLMNPIARLGNRVDHSASLHLLQRMVPVPWKFQYGANGSMSISRNRPKQAP